MSKKIFLVLLAAAFVAAPLSAKKVTKEYQRPSLHFVLINTDEPTSEQVADLIPQIQVAWDQYEFPTLYNQLPLGLKSMKGGTPKGGTMELITRFGSYDKLKNLTANDLKEINELKSGKAYINDLKERCSAVEDELAHQILTHWFNIQPDGTYSLDTIAKYACYGATQVAALDAAATTDAGAQVTLLNDLMEPTIANSYVAFSKVALYANEPIAAFTRDLAIVAGEIAQKIAEQAGTPGAGLIGPAARVSALAAYEATKEGYSAYNTTLLYKLAWNDSISLEFNQLLKPADPSNPWTGKIDMAAFKAKHFGLEFLNSDQCHNVVTRTIGNKDEDHAGLTRLTIKKNLNKQIVNLQNKNEEFKPMVPILKVEAKYLLADMGTKEEVRANETFNVIAPEADERGVIKYKVVGQVKVKKDAIWDNEIDMAEAADNAAVNQEVLDLQGTQLTGAGVKAAKEGMFVKRVKGKAKK